MQEDISLCHASADNSRNIDYKNSSVLRLLTENYEPQSSLNIVWEQDKTPKIDLKTQRPNFAKDTNSNGSLSASKFMMVDTWGSTSHKQAVKYQQVQSINPDTRNY